ncbi:uncharacterized protein [Rutidosis leptorrhynchoides]|uniref:uncharacterized protein n=1 Tax=Rutidosis leptorrhynchoides TaxID=125765 RepID=UPI003A98FC49
MSLRAFLSFSLKDIYPYIQHPSKPFYTLRFHSPDLSPNPILHLNSHSPPEPPTTFIPEVTAATISSSTADAAVTTGTIHYHPPHFSPSAPVCLKLIRFSGGVAVCCCCLLLYLSLRRCPIRFGRITRPKYITDGSKVVSETIMHKPCDLINRSAPYNNRICRNMGTFADNRCVTSSIFGGSNTMVPRVVDFIFLVPKSECVSLKDTTNCRLLKPGETFTLITKTKTCVNRSSILFHVKFITTSTNVLGSYFYDASRNTFVSSTMYTGGFVASLLSSSNLGRCY